MTELRVLRTGTGWLVEDWYTGGDVSGASSDGNRRVRVGDRRDRRPDCIPIGAASSACASVAARDGDASAGPGGLEVDAGVDGGPSGGGPEQSFVRGPGHDPCTYRSLSAHGLLAWHISYSYQGNDDPPEPAPDQYYGNDPDVRWALAHCPANAGRDVLVWWPVGGRPPASLIDALRQRARDAVPFPVLAQRAAPSGERDAPFITQMPTWLWVDPAAWGPVQAQASIPGIVTVTAVGTPERLTWDPGTGDAPVACDGPGVAYDFGVRTPPRRRPARTPTATRPTSRRGGARTSSRWASSGP